MKLMLACRAFDNMAGGVERQAIALMNEMVARGHEVQLLTLDPENARAFYEMDPKITWHRLGLGDPDKKASLSIRLRRMKKVRKIVSEFSPDLILAFQQGMFVSMRFYTMGLSIPVIAAERESPDIYDFTNRRHKKGVVFQAFRLAPYITVQCPSYIESYPSYLRSKIRIIPNAVFPANISAAPKEKIILCVGRLTDQKNQMVLIESFARLADQFPDWRLVLAGEGNKRPAIESRIADLGLKDKIDLLGAVKDVPGLYAKAEILCIPSKWEGFPNVLGEALAHGVPAIGYGGCGGVRDLIQHGKNGLLAAGNGDVESLTSALKTLLGDEALRAQMRAAAVESVRDYNPAFIYNQWEDFLKKAAGA